ncbi:hypothetical protein O181_019350 [Austropuccinia psidii MF-1]|uniref:Uncharacterized protein n=1 Tax=Austropuccinia psidii MF-1 TaxID=1389203 RepID=A0A9Q3GUY5_9BASI|nr:hypothetical protein [Austropuccinia psidii MF-1]
MKTNPEKKNSCHNCGSTYHYYNSFQKAKKKIYFIEQSPEEEIQGEDSESDSMGDAIRENSDYGQDPIEEFLVEYQEETQLEEGLPQKTFNKKLVKIYTGITNISSHTN